METRRGPVPSTIVVVCLLAVATPAQAYLDPSTGSMILSAVIGLVATLGLALKTYWYRVRAFFRRADRPRRDELARASEPVDDGGAARR